MRTESPPTLSVTAADAPSWWRRGDVVAAVLLITLPAVIFGVPALLGHAVLPGDDLTQNFPLRVLAGREIRAGHMPLLDPYIWSGAPLLAGWNAAAAYPLTWLFAVLPGTAAWTLNMIITWAVAGLGMFCFLRALRLASLASFVGAFSFAFAGGMSAQVTHFGLVAGLSWVPLALLSILRLAQDSPVRSRLGWIAVLAAALGLVILAGEPRAIDDAGVILLIYAAWQVARQGRRAGPAAVSVTAGLALGACLGAVQWLPGLAAISSSQRGVDSMALYSSGSLPVRWVLLTLVPDLLGGSGSLGQPGFFGFYNLTEVTSYVGILPLVAAFALLGRLRWRRRPPEWLVWHLMAFAGLALALGGNTPLGNVLYHLPLFGDQRLQSRNILVVDLALAVLLAYWADQPFHAARTRRVTRETILGLVPPLAVVAAAVLGVAWGTSWMRWVGLNISPSLSVVTRLKPYLLPYAVLGVAAAALVTFGWQLGRRLRSRLMAGFVVVDVIVFTILAVVQVGPGLFASASPAAPSAASSVLPSGGTGPVRPVAALGYPGRFAIYDPDLLDPAGLSGLDPPDNNSMPSIQGYSSTVDGVYAAATGSHQATGNGQDTLTPTAVADGTLDQLDTSVLLTPAAYLMTSADGNGPAGGAPGTGWREAAADQRATWYLGAVVDVSRVELPDPDAGHDARAGTQIGLTTASGSTRWFRAQALTPSTLAIALSAPVASVAVLAQAHAAPGVLGPPSVVAANGRVSVADGQLQDALISSRWQFAGFDGPFAVFANRLAEPPLRVEARPGKSASGAWVRDASGPAAAPTSATVSSPDGVRVVRSVAAIAGWSATWQPRHGPATALTVRRDGLVQVVDVPPGLGVLTFRYTPPGLVPGLALSLIAGVLVAGFFVAAVLARRARGYSPGPDAPVPVTPTAALSASRAEPCRTASARSNGPVQARPT
jgi:hypothetical protein